MGICGGSEKPQEGGGERRPDTGRGDCHLKIEWIKENFQPVEMDLSQTVLHLKQHLPEVLNQFGERAVFEPDVKRYLHDHPDVWATLQVCNSKTGMLVPDDKVLGTLESGGRSILVRTKAWESFKADVRLRMKGDPAYAPSSVRQSMMPEEYETLPGMNGIVYGNSAPPSRAGLSKALCCRASSRGSTRWGLAGGVSNIAGFRCAGSCGCERSGCG